MWKKQTAKSHEEGKYARESARNYGCSRYIWWSCNDRRKGRTANETSRRSQTRRLHRGRNKDQPRPGHAQCSLLHALSQELPRPPTAGLSIQNLKSNPTTKNATRRRNNQPKRQKPADNNEDEYHFGRASIHMMAPPAHTGLWNLWALDTGCTQHLSYRKQDFITMKPYTGRVIQGIGGSRIQPKGVGTVKLGCNIRGRRVVMLLSDTLFIQTLALTSSPSHS